MATSLPDYRDLALRGAIDELDLRDLRDQLLVKDEIIAAALDNLHVLTVENRRLRHRLAEQNTQSSESRQAVLA